jgi:cyclopropane fatty-acyl-phospholipid synthase-like methyltransferase
VTDDFYTVLADHYDELFGCSEELVRFLQAEGARPGEGGPVLDTACGTGACTRALLRRGVDAYGVDLSQPMIRRGRELARMEGLDPARLAVGDMMRVRSHPAVPFELIFCVGNSISHLASVEQVGGFIAEASAALRLGGALVLQFVAVSTMDEGEELVLPDLRAGDVAMRRVYTRTSERSVRFDAWLEDHHVSQRLLVLDVAEVTAALESAGLRESRVYGGFDRSAPTGNGWVRVIVARS